MLTRPGPQEVERENPLDVPGVEPVGHVLRQRLIKPAQELGFRQSERGIDARIGEVNAVRVDSENGRKSCPEQVGRAIRRDRDHVYVVHRDVP